MTLGNLKPEIQRGLAIAMPAAVGLFAAILLVPKAISIHQISQEATARQQQAAARQRANEIELGILNGQRLAARPQTKDEQLLFLKQLNQLFGSTQIRLVSYKPAAGAAEEKNEEKKTKGGSSVITPLASEVAVSGTYPNMVRLFRSLALADRLFSVENLKMRTDSYPRLSATFRLVRYVTPVHMAMGGDAPASGAAPGAGG